MQPQKLCLKWNNHTTNLLTVLGGFQQADILVDVTISCEGHNIKAHKMVLSACSPYFQSIFLDNPCKHPVVIINGIKYEDITAILNFMYKGEVNVSHDGLSSFLQAAEALKVKGLAEVCGEKKSSTNSISQEVQQSEQNRPQRTETPPRKRHRNRKRSLSDSNRSDDEGTSRKHREPSSPEIHELSGDESFTGDNTSNGPPFSSNPRVPQNVYSRSHQSSSNMGAEEDDEYEVEPSKLLEQTLTTDSVSMNNSNADNNLRIERIMGNATEIESSSLQEPESPPDIKPIIEYGESSAGPSEGSMMLYNEQSQPGPSNMQDGSLLHDNSHAQGIISFMKCCCKQAEILNMCVHANFVEKLALR